MWKSKSAWLLLLTLVAVASLSATGSSAATDEDVVFTPRAPEEYEGTITIWYWDVAGGERLTELFNEVYPNVTIEWVPTSTGEFLTKYQTALMANTDLPDVVMMNPAIRGVVFPTGSLEDLSEPPYNLDTSIFYEPVVSSMLGEDGEVFGIEREVNFSGIAYKRDLVLEYFGTDDPDELSAILATWDDFVEEGKRIRDESNGEVYMTFGIGDLDRIMPAQVGDPVFVDDVAYITRTFSDTLKYQAIMRDEGIVDTIGAFTGPWRAAHADDYHIFTMCAPWSPGFIIKPNDPDGAGNWGLMHTPSGGYSYGGTAYGIASSSENKELAWEFIRWNLTTEEGCQATVDSLGGLVSLESFYDDLQPNPDPYFGGQDITRYFLEEIGPTVEIRPVSEFDATFFTVLRATTAQMENNPDMTAEEGLEYMKSEFEASLPERFEVR